MLYRAFRIALRLGGTFYGALGIFILAGAVLAVAGTLAFAALAGHVRSGATQRFDDAALAWIGAHRSSLIDRAALEFTALGTGLVVFTIVAVAGGFLWLTRHRYSAGLLLVATAGGIVLNNVLKLGFDRPRPDIITWQQTPLSSSFPSGHAMSAAIVYFTVAYLMGRLQRRLAARVLTALVASVIVILIAITRLYLGVHYPSDVLGGIVIGLAWTGFCMATLEALQRLAVRRAPEVMEQEEPAPEMETREEADERKRQHV